MTFMKKALLKPVNILYTLIGNMKTLYLVETSTGGRWEMNPGFHFVMAEDIKDATKIVNTEITDEKVISVNEVSQLMIGKVFRTIISSQEE